MKTTSKILIVCLALLFIQTLNAQNLNALPGVQWNYSAYSQYHQVPVGEDWFYGVIATSDGGSLGIGYAETPNPNTSNTYAVQPTASKIDKNGNLLGKWF